MFRTPLHQQPQASAFQPAVVISGLDSTRRRLSFFPLPLYREQTPTIAHHLHNPFHWLNQFAINNNNNNKSSEEKSADALTSTLDEQIIAGMLRHIEKANNVSIVFAAEAGARQWSFATRESPFHIRFVYVTSSSSLPAELKNSSALRTRIDTLNGSFAGGERYTWSGVELHTALEQAANMHPHIYELFFSTKVYRGEDDASFADQVRRLLSEQNRVTLMSNYRQLSHAYFKELIVASANSSSSGVTIGDYMSAIRPMLMFEWLFVHMADNDEGEMFSRVEMSLERVLATLLARKHPNDFEADKKREVFVNILKWVKSVKAMPKQRADQQTSRVARMPIVDEWLEKIYKDGLYFIYRVRDKGPRKNHNQCFPQYVQLYHAIMLKMNKATKEAD